MDEDRTYLTGEDPASPGENPAPAAENPASPGENPAPAAQAPFEEPVTEERPALDAVAAEERPALEETAAEENSALGETAIVPAGQPWEEKRGQRGEDLQGQEPAGYRPGDNPMAMASMVCGILSFFGICCCGLGGFLLGSLAILFGLLSRMGQKMETRAAAGIAMGAASMVISLALLISLVVIGMANAS